MIRIQNVSKSHGARRVLNAVSAEVPEGAIVTLTGPSGSGKSTLLRCLVALESFDSGSVQIAGFSLEPGNTHRAPPALCTRVGLVFQDFQLFPHLSVLENVTLAPRVVSKVPRAEAERGALDWLARVGLSDRAASRPSQLSGGQKQRVALARALAQGARVLLLDEPTSALDREARREIQSLLRELARGALGAPPLTILIVSHDLDLASELSDEVWVLEAGAIRRKERAGEPDVRRLESPSGAEQRS